MCSTGITIPQSPLAMTCVVASWHRGLRYCCLNLRQPCTQDMAKKMVDIRVPIYFSQSRFTRDNARQHCKSLICKYCDFFCLFWQLPLGLFNCQNSFLIFQEWLCFDIYPRFSIWICIFWFVPNRMSHSSSATPVSSWGLLRIELEKGQGAWDARFRRINSHLDDLRGNAAW